MRWAQIGALPPLLGLLVGACAAPAPGQTGSAPPEQAQPGRTLVVAGRAERPSLSPRPFQNLGLTAGLDGRMFNAHLTIDNDAGLPVPYLAENVPQLNTDTWRVLPDGSMETRYRLKENLVWHDGHPMTSDDFVFAYRVLWNPAFGLNSSPPGSLIAEVTATDPRTVLIRWSSTYPQADSNGAEAVPPFPRHLLEQDYQAQDPEAFMANPFWNAGYVHAGPYRLERLEPGVFVEGVAFDQHVLGKPRIPRIRQLIMPDPNTVLANLLSGDVHLTTGDSIRFTDGETLRAQWGDRGQVLNFPNLYRITQFQYKPADASTRAFTDLRVRKADRKSVV